VRAHTPGPWFLNGRTVATNNRDTAGWPPPKTLIASLADGEYIDNTNAAADGALIAASPDLLAACEGLLDVMALPYELQVQRVEAAERAVAKARGK